MLEMSNGYPNSTSPLGGSPSPGPSPMPPNLQMKIDEPSKMSSSTTTTSARPNLRVVIPTPHEEVINFYNEKLYLISDYVIK